MNGNCEACGHGRVHHRRTDMISPEPCSQFVESGGVAGDCGCRAAFEVEKQQGTLARVAGLLAGTLSGDGKRIVVEHRPGLSGPPWHLTLEERTTSEHEGFQANVRVALTVDGFTLDEVADKLAAQAEGKPAGRRP